MPNLRGNLTHIYSHICHIFPWGRRRRSCRHRPTMQQHMPKIFIYDHRHKMLINFFNMIYLIVCVGGWLYTLCEIIAAPHHEFTLYKEERDRKRDIYGGRRSEVRKRNLLKPVMWIMHSEFFEEENIKKYIYMAKWWCCKKVKGRHF